MILTCPACSSRYVVDPQQIGKGGRMVRCARCQEKWWQDPPSAPPPQAEPPAAWKPDPADAPQSYAMDSPAQPTIPSFMGAAAPMEPFYGKRGLPALPEPPRKVSPKAMAWMAAVFLLAILAGLLATERQAVVALWPGSESLYAAIGLGTNSDTAGLQLRGINSAFSMVDGKQALVVSGSVENISGVPRIVPPLTVTVRDAQNQPIDHWTVTPDHPQLAAGQSLPFQSTLDSPPANAKSVFVTMGPS